MFTDLIIAVIVCVECIFLPNHFVTLPCLILSVLFFFLFMMVYTKLLYILCTLYIYKYKLTWSVTV